MAEIDGSHVRKTGEVMSLIEHKERQPVAIRKAPVRVTLERIECEVSRSLPPDGDRQTWIDRLKAALGTTSTEFVDTTL
jgi:hypothetical protein